MRLVPKNWERFQHYRDRCPPWIKLHRDLLNDRAFIMLPTASKALAPLMWLLASESRDGSFDASVEELEFRLRMPAGEIKSGLKALIEHGFFLNDSTMLAPCLRDAIPEREGETETEREGETELEPKGSCASEDAPLVASEVLEGWNELAGSLGLAKVRKLTDARRRKVNAQAKRFPIADWQIVFSKIAGSPFLRGENRNGWRCDFDFILSENNFVKILEGKYDKQ